MPRLAWQTQRCVAYPLLREATCDHMEGFTLQCGRAASDFLSGMAGRTPRAGAAGGDGCRARPRGAVNGR